MTHPNTFS
jgi:hypothetical protein